MTMAALILALLASFTALARAADLSPEVALLAAEVRGMGWIVFPARSEQGDWDLFLMRPDGSQRRALTQTPDWSELLTWPKAFLLAPTFAVALMAMFSQAANPFLYFQF